VGHPYDRREIGRTANATAEQVERGVIIADVAQLPGRPDAGRRVKGSGVGREGLCSAMDDYTEPRVMVLTGSAR